MFTREPNGRSQNTTFVFGLAAVPACAGFTAAIVQFVTRPPAGVGGVSGYGRSRTIVVPFVTDAIVNRVWASITIFRPTSAAVKAPVGDVAVVLPLLTVMSVPPRTNS